MTDPQRILIVRPSALGDVCRTVPVLVSLKRRFPEAFIDWLVQDSFAPAIAHHPDLNRVVPFPRKQVAISRWGHADARALLWTLLRDLRSPHYDLVIDCQGLGRSGFFAWITRAPARVGFADAREFGWLGLTARVRARRTLHTVDRMLALANFIGADPTPDMRLYPGDDDRPNIDPRLLAGPFVVLAPTSRWLGKRWPADRFASLASRLLDDNLTERIAVVGAASERDQSTPLTDLARDDPRIIDLVGSTSIGTLLATIERSSLLIANDSAALHMAVGLNRPLIGLFGPTRIDLVGPYHHDADVIQAATPTSRNRHKHAKLGQSAMNQIQLEDVFRAAEYRHCTESSEPALHEQRRSV